MNYILHGHDEGRVKQKINALKTKHHIENVIVFDATDDEQQDVFNEMDTISIFDDDKNFCFVLMFNDDEAVQCQTEAGLENIEGERRLPHTSTHKVRMLQYYHH